jgi:hypothetical protein
VVVGEVVIRLEHPLISHLLMILPKLPTESIIFYEYNKQWKQPKEQVHYSQVFN